MLIGFRCSCISFIILGLTTAPCQVQGVRFMNKKIKEASLEEIKEAYVNKVPSIIANYRYYSRELQGFNEDGVAQFGVRFNRFMAQRYNLGFEFRIWESDNRRKSRLRKRIEKMIMSNRAQFLTLTFNDSFLSRDTSEETRRRYVARFLKEQCIEYVANIDFGVDDRFTKREHYHALVVPKNATIDYSAYTHGFDKSRINAKNVKVRDKDSYNIAKYINKLTNHSLKASGRYKRLIYSRG